MEEESAASSSLIEFAVNMTCGSCDAAVRKSLSNVDGITSIKVDLAQQRVLVTTTQPSSVIQKAIETTGMLAVLKGQGQGPRHLGAAVSIVKAKQHIHGLVRFTQINKETCIVDGSFNGLRPGKYALHIHEFGDLSEGCDSTGDDYNPNGGGHGNRTDNNRHVGDMGNVEANSDGSAVFRYEDDLIKVWDIIGRAVVLHEKEDDFTNHPHGNAGKGFACGIVARSSGLFQNKKMVCTCTGKTIWEERIDAREEIG